MFTNLMSLREISGDEAVQFAAWYFSLGFYKTVTDRKIGWRLNYDVSYYINEVLVMAQKRKTNAPTPAPNRLPAVEWLNISLSVEDGDQIDAWLTTEPDVLGEVCRLVVEGYGFTIKPANRGDGFMATLTFNSEDVRTPGRGLSAFADTPYEAIACLLYKFVTKLDSTFEGAVTANRSRFR